MCLSQVLRLIGRGDYCGELALLSDEPRAASGVARTFCELQVLTKKHFDEIMRDWPDYCPGPARAFKRS